jgi:hypothetical protein
MVERSSSKNKKYQTEEGMSKNSFEDEDEGIAKVEEGDYEEEEEQRKKKYKVELVK